MDNLPVNVTDIAIIAMVLLSGILAFARGFFREVLSSARGSRPFSLPCISTLSPRPMSPASGVG